MKGYFLIGENFENFYGLEYDEGLKKSNFKIVENVDLMKEGYKKVVFVPSEIYFFTLSYPKDLKKDLKYMQIENEIFQKMEQLALDVNSYIYTFREYKNLSNKKLTDIYVYIYPKVIFDKVNEVYLIFDFFVNITKQKQINESFILIIPFKNLVVDMFFDNQELKNIRITFLDDLEQEKIIAKQIFFEEHQKEIADEFIFRLDKEMDDFLNFLKYKQKCNIIEDKILNLMFCNCRKLIPLFEKNKMLLFINNKDLKKVIMLFLILNIVILGGGSYHLYNYYLLKQELNKKESDLSSIEENLLSLKEYPVIKKFENSEINKNLKKLKIPIILEFIYQLKKFCKDNNINIINISSNIKKKKKILFNIFKRRYY
jgi:hypothetical protein